MSSKVVVLIGVLALVAMVAAADADTITSQYKPATKTWEYTVAFTDMNATAFRVYLDPNMSIDYLADITDDNQYWSSPSSLGTDFTWNTITLPYLEWTKTNPLWGGGTVVFSYADALYKPDGVHVMDLANHPGPLLYNPPAYAGAPSVETFGSTATVQESGHWVAITPEPATMTLLGLSLIGVAGFVRRRRST